MPKPSYLPAPNASATHQFVHVQPHHSQLLYWPAGTVFTPERGAVWLTETPRWIGEQLHRQRVRVEAHGSHVMAEAGWVAVWAEQEAVLKVAPGWVAPQGLRAVVQPAWRLALAAWRRARNRLRRSPARLA